MAFLAILVVYILLLAWSFLYRANLKTLRTERETVEAQVAGLQEYELLYDRMNAAERRLNMAMGSAPSWSEFLLEAGAALPTETTWLSEMTLNYSAESGFFNMRGWSYTHDGVADMLDGIQALNQLEEVRCRVATETDFQGRNSVQFVVDAVLLPGPPYLEHAETGPTEQVAAGPVPDLPEPADPDPAEPGEQEEGE